MFERKSLYLFIKNIPSATPITTSKMQNPPRTPINSVFQFFDVTSYFNKTKGNDSYLSIKDTFGTNTGFFLLEISSREKMWKKNLLTINNISKFEKATSVHVPRFVIQMHVRVYMNILTFTIWSKNRTSGDRVS